MTRKILSALLCFASSVPALAEDRVYQGEWVTTNRKLDGVMTGVITPLGDEEWQGRFYGTWQGVDFDYKVDFTGPAKDLRGTAVIDGASYEWRGWMTRKRLKANFGGDRYVGSFDLKRRPAASPTLRAHARATTGGQR